MRRRAKDLKSLYNLFGGFCFGKSRYACNFLDLAAFAEQIDAFKTLENAAFFGRCGVAAFETVVL